MLEFNQNHRSIKGNLKKGTKVGNIIINGMIITSIMLFSGCSKNVDCNISEMHAHYYINENSFDKFIAGEKETVGGWQWTERYIVIDKEAEELINFENKNDLFKISLNQNEINEIVSSLEADYIEYRYKYRWVQFIPVKIGKVTIYNQIWHTSYSWTANPEHSNLTGEQRMVSRMFYGYKIIRDEKGNLQLVQSDMVENLSELSNEFIYLKRQFYKTVYSDNKDLEVDYEDGPEEQKPNYEKQQDYQDPEPLESDNSILKV